MATTTSRQTISDSYSTTKAYLRHAMERVALPGRGASCLAPLPRLTTRLCLPAQGMEASRKQAVGAPSGVPELTPWGRSGDRPYRDYA
jgi:hypothetical protein